MRRFYFIRNTDVSGVSGTGVVAEGVQFSDGVVAIRWRTELASTVIWDDVEQAIKVHGHDGATELIWEDELDPDIDHVEPEDQGNLGNHDNIVDFPPLTNPEACDCGDVWINTAVVVSNGRITSVKTQGECSSCGTPREVYLKP